VVLATIAIAFVTSAAMFAASATRLRCEQSSETIARISLIPKARNKLYRVSFYNLWGWATGENSTVWWQKTAEEYLRTQPITRLMEFENGSIVVETSRGMLLIEVM
jgi:hypothetical protein